jgi:predicted ester cyclase
MGGCDVSTEEIEQLDAQGISAWSDHDADAWVSLMADDVVLLDWTIAEPIRGREGPRQYFNAWLTAFPDMQVTQTNKVVGEDAIAAEIEFRGTNTGPMVMAGNEVPPTSRSVVGRGTYMVRFRHGRVIEFNAHPDAAGLMMQLGLMPQM